MADDLWGFQAALPAVFHRGTNDGTMPLCAAAKYELGVGEVGPSRYVSDDPAPPALPGYAGSTWCPRCNWVVEWLKTPEADELFRTRAPTVKLIVIGR